MQIFHFSWWFSLKSYIWHWRSVTSCKSILKYSLSALERTRLFLLSVFKGLLCMSVSLFNEDYKVLCCRRTLELIPADFHHDLIFCSLKPINNLNIIFIRLWLPFKASCTANSSCPLPLSQLVFIVHSGSVQFNHYLNCSSYISIISGFLGVKVKSLCTIMFSSLG